MVMITNYERLPLQEGYYGYNFGVLDPLNWLLTRGGRTSST